MLVLTALYFTTTKEAYWLDVKLLKAEVAAYFEKLLLFLKVCDISLIELFLLIFKAHYLY